MTPESASERSQLGELLVEAGFVREEDVRAALAHQREVGDLPLGEILVERGLLSRLALAQALGEQWSAENRRLRRVPDPEPVSDQPAPVTTGHLAELREAIAELRELVSALEAAAGKAFVRAHTVDADLHRLVEELTNRLDGLDAPPQDTGGDSNGAAPPATTEAENRPGEAQAPLDGRTTSSDPAKGATPSRAAVSSQDRIERPPIRPMRDPLPPSFTRNAR